MSAGGNLPWHPEKKVIDSARRALIDRLLLERISLAGFARAVHVSEVWLLLLRQLEICQGGTKCASDSKKKADKC
jgi:hypothetical protein